jgi:hypothetical protein
MAIPRKRKKGGSGLESSYLDVRIRVAFNLRRHECILFSSQSGQETSHLQDQPFRYFQVVIASDCNSIDVY